MAPGLISAPIFGRPSDVNRDPSSVSATYWRSLVNSSRVPVSSNRWGHLITIFFMTLSPSKGSDHCSEPVQVVGRQEVKSSCLGVSQNPLEMLPVKRINEFLPGQFRVSAGGATGLVG